MIDMESAVVSEVITALRADYPGILVTSTYVKTPSSFPCVQIMEIDNAVYRNSSDSSTEENHAAVTYEVNVFSNKTSGKKAECREIAGAVDTILSRMNFTRMMLEPIPNFDDATIYRMVARYRAVFGANNTIYRR